jgi:hypothetical protein
MRLRAVCLITATSVALAATMLVGAVANAQTLATNASKSTTIARGLVDPGAWLVSSGLYLSSASSSPQGSTEVTLTHVNSSTGKIEARAHLDAQPVSVTETGGKLWFATDTVTKGGLTTATSVTALNPSTLRTEVKLKLPAVAAVPSLAAAGGYLWAADGSALVRISPSNGTVTKTISAASSDGPHAILTGIGTDSRGRSLVTSVLNRAAAPRVQRRNSRSGSVERQSATLGAVSAGHLSVYDNGVWTSIITGTEGYVQRLSLTTLLPTGKPIGRQSSNGITGQVYGGVLYVTDPNGSASTNYCGNARTGTLRSSLPLVINGALLTAGAADYYFVPSELGTSHRVKETAVPTACR